MKSWWGKLSVVIGFFIILTSFLLKVYSQEEQRANYQILNTKFVEIIGDNNGILQEGETINFNFDLQNSGEASQYVIITVSSDDGNIIFKDSYKKLELGEVLPGESKNIKDFFSFEVKKVDFTKQAIIKVNINANNNIQVIEIGIDLGKKRISSFYEYLVITNPTIYEDKVYWFVTNKKTNKAELFLYNISTNNEELIDTLGTNVDNCFAPQCSKNHIAWLQRDKDYTYEKYLSFYLYDFNTKDIKCLDTLDAYANFSFSLSDDKIVWGRKEKSGLNVYSFATQELKKIGEGAFGLKNEIGLFKDDIIFVSNYSNDIFYLKYPGSSAKPVVSGCRDSINDLVLFKNIFFWVGYNNSSREQSIWSSQLTTPGAGKIVFPTNSLFKNLEIHSFYDKYLTVYTESKTIAQAYLRDLYLIKVSLNGLEQNLIPVASGVLRSVIYYNPTKEIYNNKIVWLQSIGKDQTQTYNRVYCVYVAEIKEKK